VDDAPLLDADNRALQKKPALPQNTEDSEEGIVEDEDEDEENDDDDEYVSGPSKKAKRQSGSKRRMPACSLFSRFLIYLLSNS
jgi:hypothetical protein